MLEQFERGVIEGFYGREWSWATRSGYAAFLRDNGFSFYLYAPKYDLVLRKRWREDWSPEDWEALQGLRACYREAGVQFGIGFTPFGTQSQYGADERRALTEKIARLDALDLDIFCLLSDDVPGVPSDLAERQVAIIHDALATIRFSTRPAARDPPATSRRSASSSTRACTCSGPGPECARRSTRSNTSRT